jgi:5'-methylthioinosine phosphorylase
MRDEASGGTAGSSVAIIGGSGFYRYGSGQDSETVSLTTPFSSSAEQVELAKTPAGSILFMPRHGEQHSIAPHEINYRSKLWALHRLGARFVVAVNAVGGISRQMQPGTLVLPDQLIDYTWGRQHTFVEGNHSFAAHVDFTDPYDAAMADLLASAARQSEQPLVRGGVYGCTQGPRLETAAEIRKLAADGCDIVGMTGMPEAGLARELGLRYCCVALVVNRAAGLQSGEVSLDAIRAELDSGVSRIRTMVDRALPGIFALAGQ